MNIARSIMILLQVFLTLSPAICRGDIIILDDFSTGLTFDDGNAGTPWWKILQLQQSGNPGGFRQHLRFLGRKRGRHRAGEPGCDRQVG